MLDEDDDFRPNAETIHSSILSNKKSEKLAMSLNGSFMVNNSVNDTKAYMK